ncbi:MAG: Uma2 family endonuclease [Snowella sp.]|nr:Uma2 family endonuclease [Snowella sp.]
MIISPSKPKVYTPEEYLTLETSSEIRNEYRNGEITPMTGGTPAHNQIISALNALLWFGLRGKNYSIFVTDQRLWIPDKNLYTYPDVMVIQNPLQLQTGRKDTVINPLLIAEVLSDSTKAYDRDEKFAAYRTVSTFQEYFLIEQSSPHIEQYIKQADRQWLFREYDGLESKIQLHSVSLELALADLYENIDFSVE